MRRRGGEVSIILLRRFLSLSLLLLLFWFPSSELSPSEAVEAPFVFRFVNPGSSFTRRRMWCGCEGELGREERDGAELKSDEYSSSS